MIDTRGTRPPPPQEENLDDGTQGWTHSADGRRNPGDSRFARGASGGYHRPRYADSSPSPHYSDPQSSEETERDLPIIDPLEESETGEIS
jgi:hypothetical protein